MSRTMELWVAFGRWVNAICLFAGRNTNDIPEDGCHGDNHQIDCPASVALQDCKAIHNEGLE